MRDTEGCSYLDDGVGSVISASPSRKIFDLRVESVRDCRFEWRARFVYHALGLEAAEHWW